MGEVVGDGVARFEVVMVGAEEGAVVGAELDVGVLPHGLQLEGGVREGRKGLEDLAAGHANEGQLVGGSEVLAVVALEADDRFGVEDELDRPLGTGTEAPAAQVDGLIIVPRDEVLAVAAPEAHRPGIAEKLHA